MRKFFSEISAADTIPLKLVVYTGLFAAVLILMAQAWNTSLPVLEDAKTKDQVETAALGILSIQQGYARELGDKDSSSGTMCLIKFSCPDSIRYISFGIDPDPESNGNLNDSNWITEDNTIIYQYKNGVKKRVFLDGENIRFIKGEPDSEGIWFPNIDENGNIAKGFSKENAVIIEAPVSGEFSFETVMQKGVRYTMSHF
jgi:hypothetical protein